jgi:lactonase
MIKEVKTVEAEPWFQVSEKGLQLEGLCFDRTGDLYFVEVFGGTLMKLCVQEMKLESVFSLEGYNPAAVKIHKDGRIFVACLGDFKNGGIVVWNPKTDNSDWLIRPEQGYVIDDLVFDSDGGFYFTDFKGKSTEPTGGIYYVYPDEKTIKQVIGNMAVPNGVALTPDERGLWVTEMCANRLHYIELNEDRVTIPPFGTAVPYYFEGAFRTRLK